MEEAASVFTALIALPFKAHPRRSPWLERRTVGAREKRRTGLLAVMMHMEMQM